LPKQAKEYLAK